jgi:hypothetical protein
MQRRRLLGVLAGALGAAWLPAAVAQGPAASGGNKPQIEVWKDPDCGCCKDWVTHLEANGFVVRVNDTGNAAARTRLGMPTKFGSCHTGLVGGYVIEGHVPAREILRLLREKPAVVGVLGLAVPGMPVGSPGMDGAIYGDRRDPYDVLLVSRDGSTRVYQSYNRKMA